MSQKTPKGKKEKAEEFVNKDLWQHETFKILMPEYIRDANRRRPDDPEYDPKTLYIPPDFFKENKVTPGHQQWWKFKAEYCKICFLVFVDHYAFSRYGCVFQSWKVLRIVSHGCRHWY